MEDKDKIIQVSIEDILPNRFQPRLAFDEKELNELSNSILKYGVIQPIVLRKIGSKYEIIAGERRYKATVMAGLKTIPAIINDADDNTSAEIALLENLQRKNLTVIEEAQSFKKLLDRNFTQEEIANKLGVSQSSIANKLRLLNLPKQVQDALLFNKISERHARSLLSLNDTNVQIDMLNKIINERMTVRQTEEEIKKVLNSDNDIPKNVIKYIEAEKEENEEPTKFVQYIPDVVNIEENNINPFQAKFQKSINKIEENINNKESSYYDKIINEDLKNNLSNFDNNKHIEFDDEENEKPTMLFEDELEQEKDKDKDKGIKLEELLKKIEEKPEKKEKVSIISIVNKVRDLVGEFDDERIRIKEDDFPDKYRISLEIEKDVD